MRLSLHPRAALTSRAGRCAVAAVVITLVTVACSATSDSHDHARRASAQSHHAHGPGDAPPDASKQPSSHHRTGNQIQKLQRGQILDLKESVKRAIAERRARARAPFVVASLNVLGASHTAGAQARHGYASGPSRIIRLASTIVAKEVSVVGLQEFQPPQLYAFQRVAGAAYDVYPAMTLGARASDNSIAWRRSDWKPVATHTVAIPYFFGRIRQMPYVLLKNRWSGKEVWFMNFHNPANIGGNMARWRSAALGIEARLVHTLHASGRPVILTGDMNDRAAFACPFTAQSAMHSANGAYWAAGRCHAPAHMDVDWVMGTSGITFSDFLSDDSTRAAHLTDHPMITASVKLP